MTNAGSVTTVWHGGVFWRARRPGPKQVQATMSRRRRLWVLREAVCHGLRAAGPALLWDVTWPAVTAMRLRGSHHRPAARSRRAPVERGRDQRLRCGAASGGSRHQRRFRRSSAPPAELDRLGSPRRAGLRRMASSWVSARRGRPQRGLVGRGLAPLRLGPLRPEVMEPPLRGFRARSR